MKICNSCNSNPAQPGRNKCRPCRYEKNEKSFKPVRTKVKTGELKILMIDIETSPLISYHWDLWNQNIGINQILVPKSTLCVAAKWYGKDEVIFKSRWKDGQERMIQSIWELLNQADMVIHFYGSRFDVPHLNTEFLLHGMTAPRPYKQVDLKMAVSKNFKFDSNKLQFVSQALQLEGKVEHEGFPLWGKVVNFLGDYSEEVQNDARERMRVYNERDVTLLEEVYEVLLPWIPSHPHRHLYNADGYGCPTCGHDKLVEAGLARTRLSVFQQYECTGCHSFFRGSKRLYGVNLQESILF